MTVVNCNQFPHLLPGIDNGQGTIEKVSQKSCTLGRNGLGCQLSIFHCQFSCLCYKMFCPKQDECSSTLRVENHGTENYGTENHGTKCRATMKSLSNLFIDPS